MSWTTVISTRCVTQRNWRHWSIPFCQLQKVFWQMVAEIYFSIIEHGCCFPPTVTVKVKKNIHIVSFWLYSILKNEKQWCICLKRKKIIEKYGFKWMVLVLFESGLYIASVMFIENKQKKDIVHDVFSSHNDVHLWNVYQIKKQEKKRKEKNKSVDALIVHVVRLVGLTSSSWLPYRCLGRRLWKT